MSILTRQPSGHERGICQRTTPQCRRVCHLVDPARGEPPIGYEAAPSATVHQLHQSAANRVPAPAPALPLYDEINDITRAVEIGCVCFMAVLLVLGLVGWSLLTDISFAHSAWQWFQTIGREVMYLGR